MTKRPIMVELRVRASRLPRNDGPASSYRSVREHSLKGRHWPRHCLHHLQPMDQSAMNRWHTEFERRAPEAHHEFLLSLGIPQDEVAKIRTYSREKPS